MYCSSEAAQSAIKTFNVIAVKDVCPVYYIVLSLDAE